MNEPGGNRLEVTASGIMPFASQGRAIEESDSLNGRTGTVYDAAGRVTRITSPQGVINYEYDTSTGQISRTWTGADSSSPVTDVRYTYDKLGRLETVTNIAREGALLAAPETAKYVYDLIGNLDRIIQANGVIAGYEYDNLNRLKELTHYAPDATPEDLSDNEVLQRFSYEYYKDGAKSQEIFTDAGGAVHIWAWAYDQLGRLIKEVHDNADDSLDYTAEYFYDLVGNRLRKTLDNGSDGVIERETVSTFDSNDRLLSETETQGGVATSRTDYIYNKTEQIAKTVTDLLTGRLETQTSLAYNAQGRLSQIVVDTYSDGLKTQTLTQEYFYDADGLKIRQIETLDADADGSMDGQSVTDYLNDKLNHTGYAQVLEERRVENGQEVKVTTYTIGHDVLVQFDAANGLLALLADGHGSTRAVADMTGHIVQEYSYDAYGQALGFNPAQALTSLLYSGEQFNSASGLQYLRARWYDPQTGRFNRLDPFAGNMRSPLSFHKYAYAHMNPVMGTDPSGLFIHLSNLMITSSIMGILTGTAIGAYLGYEGKFTLKTVGYMIVGAVAGFGIGVFVGACLGHMLGATSGLAIGKSSFASSLTAVSKIISQTNKIFTGGVLKDGSGITLGSFVLGGIAGIIAKAHGDEYKAAITESSLVSLGAIPATSTLARSFKAVRVFGTISWAFALGFNATYFAIDTVDEFLTREKS